MNFQSLTSVSHSRTAGILVILILAASVPLTVFIAQKQQEIRQRAQEIAASPQWQCNVKRYSPLVGCTGQPTSEETYISSKNESYDSCVTRTSFALITCIPLPVQQEPSSAVPIPTSTPAPIPATTAAPLATQPTALTDSNLAPCPEGALIGCRSEMPNIPGAFFEVVPNTTCRQTCYRRIFPTPTPASAVPLTPTASTPTPSPTPSPTPTPIPTQTIATVLIPPTSSPTPPPQIAASSCPLHDKGDANCKDGIDIVDFGIWQNEMWKQEMSSFTNPPTADFNNDGIVDIADFNIWKTNYVK